MTSNRHRARDVIDRALDQNRLTHAVLLKGRSMDALRSMAESIAAKLLGAKPEFVTEHPDFFILQPKNRMRQISVDHTRDLIRQIQHSPSAGSQKVALVHEVDRMNQESANAFLKTLEEPPLNTTIILTTARPHGLLDTIVSRCQAFWFQESEALVNDSDWVDWKTKFENWIRDLMSPPKERREIADRMMALYALLEGFKIELAKLSEKKWEEAKNTADGHLTDEELLAMEVGTSRGVRSSLLAEIQDSLHSFYKEQTQLNPSQEQSERISYSYVESVSELERLKGLLEVNLNEGKMLEVYFLKLLRIWSYRKS